MTDALKKKVLLVDDDAFFSKLYQKKAEQYPLEFRVVNNGKEALELLKSGTFVPDQILLDINMPDMTGVDVLREIRQQNLVPDAKISILSNTHETEYAEDYKKLKIEQFLPKTSFLPSQVLSMLTGGDSSGELAHA